MPRAECGHMKWPDNMLDAQIAAAKQRIVDEQALYALLCKEALRRGWAGYTDTKQFG